jgi:creatinine amidohydrolase
VAVEVARRVGGVVLPTYFAGTETVLPTDQKPQSPANFGFDNTERIIGMDFPDNPVKSLYFEEGVFAVMVREILRLLKADGYRLLVIVNGHGAENHQRTLRRLAIEETHPPDVQVVYTMPFVPTGPPFSAIGHAEKIETSIMMALMPDRVDVRTLPPKSLPLRSRDYGIVDGKTFDGYPTPDFTLRSESDPRDASGELGQGILAAEVDLLAQTIQRYVQSLR